METKTLIKSGKPSTGPSGQYNIISYYITYFFLYHLNIALLFKNTADSKQIWKYFHLPDYCRDFLHCRLSFILAKFCGDIQLTWIFTKSFPNNAGVIKSSTLLLLSARYRALRKFQIQKNVLFKAEFIRKNVQNFH